MTKLGSISGNHLSITCKVCGYNTLLAVKPLIERLGWEARLTDVVPNLRCSSCKAKGQVTFQIVFVGGSGEALLGGKATKEPKPTGRLSG
jgi:hypothetical protein